MFTKQREYNKIIWVILFGSFLQRALLP